MTDDQLAALSVRLQGDVALREKLMNCLDADSAITLLREAGICFSKENWYQFHQQYVAELRDDEVEGVSGSGYHFTDMPDLTPWTC